MGDLAVKTFSEMVLNDQPAQDPRWGEGRGELEVSVYTCTADGMEGAVLTVVCAVPHRVPEWSVPHHHLPAGEQADSPLQTPAVPL